MIKRIVIVVILLSILLLPQKLRAQNATETGSIVQAILFYSPTCPHCHQVMTNDLPPLQQKYGDRLQILGVDTSKPVGQQLYQNAIEELQIPQNRLGVPTLIVGEVVMVGSVEIPQQFPQLIENGLATGGIGWPQVPGLQEAVPNLPPSADPAAATDGAAAAGLVEDPEANSASEPAAVAAAPETDTAAEMGVAAPIDDLDTVALTTGAVPPPPDPVGFALAWLILAGMVAALAFVILRFRTARSNLSRMLGGYINAPVKSWAMLVLVLIGLGVAAYLAYVEIQHVAAVCGPVGECNIVQASPYARILGIPIAVLGLINYVVIGILWLWQLADSRQPLVYYTIVGLTIFGTLFSIYLTLLEIFAIHAVCAWCLTSAVVTTLLMIVVVSTLTRATPAGMLEMQLGTD